MREMGVMEGTGVMERIGLDGIGWSQIANLFHQLDGLAGLDYLDATSLTE